MTQAEFELAVTIGIMIGAIATMLLTTIIVGIPLLIRNHFKLKALEADVAAFQAKIPELRKDIQDLG